MATTASKARAAALAYDFTVLAGTQGGMNHRKTDRLLEVVEKETDAPATMVTPEDGPLITPRGGAVE